MAMNFGTKLTNSAPVKDNCSLFAPTPYYRACAIQWCHLNFSLADLCCYGNEFWNKTDYNLTPAKIIARCFYLPPIFGPGLCNGVIYIFPLKTPVVMATNRFYSKAKLAAGSPERQTLKHSC